MVLLALVCNKGKFPDLCLTAGQDRSCSKTHLLWGVGTECGFPLSLPGT